MLFVGWEPISTTLSAVRRWPVAGLNFCTYPYCPFFSGIPNYPSIITIDPFIAIPTYVFIVNVFSSWRCMNICHWTFNIQTINHISFFKKCYLIFVFNLVYCSIVQSLPPKNFGKTVIAVSMDMNLFFPSWYSLISEITNFIKYAKLSQSLINLNYFKRFTWFVYTMYQKELKTIFKGHYCNL